MIGDNRAHRLACFLELVIGDKSQIAASIRLGRDDVVLSCRCARNLRRVVGDVRATDYYRRIEGEVLLAGMSFAKCVEDPRRLVDSAVGRSLLKDAGRVRLSGGDSELPAAETATGDGALACVLLERERNVTPLCR